MAFADLLKKQLVSFVDYYKNYLWKTLGTILSLTAICFLAMSLLLRFNHFDPSGVKSQTSLLSYLFYRYSLNETFSIVDLSKSIFLFFVSLYSIALTRLTRNSGNDEQKFSLGAFVKAIQISDVLWLLGVLLLVFILDFGFVWTDTRLQLALMKISLSGWIHAIIFMLRIYVPPICFAIEISRAVSKQPPKLTVKKLVFLLSALWLFNEFAYEFFILVRSTIFGLLLSPFDTDKKFLYESILGVLLIGFYFPGYASAMTTPLSLLEE